MEDFLIQDQDLHVPKDVSFQEETGYLVVRLSKDAYGLPEEEVEYKGKSFQPKAELHITIVSRGAAEKLRQHLEEHPEDKDRIKHLIQKTGWSYRKQKRFYHVEEHPGVESIIQMVDVPGVKPFFQELSHILGEQLELPPTHVTVFTRGDPEGIGLPTQAVFDRLVTGEVHFKQPKKPDSRPGEE